MSSEVISYEIFDNILNVISFERYPETFVETKLLSVALITTMWQVLSWSILILTPCDHGLIRKVITRSVLYLFYLESTLIDMKLYI